jgi:hypothetical protein
VSQFEALDTDRPRKIAGGPLFSVGPGAGKKNFAALDFFSGVFSA